MGRRPARSGAQEELSEVHVDVGFLNTQLRVDVQLGFGWLRIAARLSHLLSKNLVCLILLINNCRLHLLKHLLVFPGFHCVDLYNI